VLEFKSTTLQQHGACPTANLVTIPIDLRQDWPTVLRNAGFDASQPTAWSAEGLLRYLSAAAQDVLIERIHELSSEASWFAANAPGKGFLDRDHLARQREQMNRLRSAAASLLNTDDIPDLDELWYAEERTDVVDWLREHRWGVSVQTLAAMLGRYGRRVPDEDVMPPTVFVSAQRSAN
jgi:methyltransferase (TIGR00027 family)